MIIHKSNTEKVTIDLTSTKSIHEYYMYLIQKEKEGIPVVTNLETTSTYTCGDPYATESYIHLSIETLNA